MTLKATVKRVVRGLRRRLVESIGKRAVPPEAPAAPSVNLGAIDTPEDGATVRSESFELAGWADTGGAPGGVVLVRVDGIVMTAAPVVGSREDVADALGTKDLSSSGFKVVVDLLPLQISSPRSVHVTAEIAGSTLGSFAAIDLEIEPEKIPLTLGYIASPTDGQLVQRDDFGVYGWAVIGGRPGRLAEIFVDGRHVETVQIGDSRPDVVDYLGDDGVEFCGFETSLHLTDRRLRGEDFPDSATLSVLIVPLEPGQPVLELGPVAVELYRPSFASYVERPLAGTRLERDFVTIYGWAYSEPDEIDSIEVFVDGVSLGLARIGLDRLDLVDLTDSRGAATAGFEFFFDFTSVALDQRRIVLDVVANLASGTRQIVARQTHQLVATRKRAKTDLQLKRDSDRLDLLRGRGRELLGGLSTPVDDGLNLLAVAHDLGYGGGQLWLSELLDQSGAGRDFACTVLAPKDGPLRKDLERLGIKVHVDGAIPVNDLEAYEGRVAELALWSRSLGHNAALVNTIAGFSGADIAARLDLPFVWAIHESWTPSAYWHVVFPKGYLDEDIRSRAEWLLGQATAVVFEAESTRQQYLNHVSPSHARVVPYGIRVEAIDRFVAQNSREAIRSRLGFRRDDQVVLVMGTIEPRKAQSLIAEAFARLVASHPHAQLVFVGDLKTRYSAAIRELTHRLCIADRVKLIPIVKDTYSWYLAADVMVCASDVESLPRSVLEAMCFGVPVVATNVFGLGELLQDDRNGYLCEPRDLGALEAALRRVLSSEPEELRRVAEAGRSTVRENHDSLGYSVTVRSTLEAALKLRKIS